MKKGAINKSWLFYLMVVCVTGFPLTCGYISDGEYLLEGSAPDSLTYEKSATVGKSYVDVPMLYHKGYQATEGGGSRLKVCTGDNNVVLIMLPENFDGDVSVSFVSPVYWRIAEVVSVVTVFTLLFLLCIGRRAKAC